MFVIQVNGIEMTGKSQSDAVSILRNTKSGSAVSLVVSRQVLETEVSPQDVSNMCSFTFFWGGGGVVVEGL